ncbi:hypothetical protein [Microbacterium sp. NPDC087591]|uniref:hypothetical protein n=1 Tax=Microbacterium sp. NPDC087591 TaxID=3364192 RepID=UPI00381B9C55
MSHDATTERRRHQQRRLTWVAGGVLLLLSVAVGLGARGPLAALSPGRDWLFAAAGVLLAIGIGHAGSITGRRFVGTVSTILLVLAPVTQLYWFALVPDSAGDPNAAEDAWVLVAAAYFGVLVVLAVISVSAIVRAGVIPSPWRWAPLWVMLWTPVTFAIGVTVFSAAPLGTPIASFGAILSLYGPAAGVAFLGVLAISLGARRSSPEAPDERWHRWSDDALPDTPLP